jgi:hypothetical protein
MDHANDRLRGAGDEVGTSIPYADRPIFLESIFRDGDSELDAKRATAVERIRSSSGRFVEEVYSEDDEPPDEKRSPTLGCLLGLAISGAFWIIVFLVWLVVR